MPLPFPRIAEAPAFHSRSCLVQAGDWDWCDARFNLAVVVGDEKGNSVARLSQPHSTSRSCMLCACLRMHRQLGQVGCTDRWLDAAYREALGMLQVCMQRMNRFIHNNYRRSTPKTQGGLVGCPRIDMPRTDTRGGRTSAADPLCAFGITRWRLVRGRE